MPNAHYKPLPWTRLKRNVSCYLPKTAEHKPVEANSPALSAMTDFRAATPVTISKDASLEDANRVMVLCHVHYLLVADRDGQLLGLVTEAGTKGQRMLAIAYERSVRPSELVVGDVMIDKRDDAEVIHLTDLVHARVGNVVTTLKELSRPYFLVVDHDEEGRHVLCGMFSMLQIERQMGLDSHSITITPTFLRS